MPIKPTKKAITAFIKGTTSMYNAYTKKYAVDTIYGVLTGKEPRKELYQNHEYTFGVYAPNGPCSGRTYYFNYAGRYLSDNLGNKIYFL